LGPAGPTQWARGESTAATSPTGLLIKAWYPKTTEADALEQAINNVD
jgi:hypothetical protein